MGKTNTRTKGVQMKVIDPVDWDMIEDKPWTGFKIQDYYKQCRWKMRKREEFCSRLGISIDSYKSYCSGRRKTPQKVLEQARMIVNGEL